MYVYSYSMGGAIAVHTAIRHLVPSLIGLIVIDVVEGKCAVKLKALALDYQLSRLL